jgi:hypothetical protein
MIVSLKRGMKIGPGNRQPPEGPTRLRAPEIGDKGRKGDKMRQNHT